MVAAMSSAETRPERLPVSVLTGFLGSGKTTLLGRLIRQPDMGRTAVVINEFGEIGLDHDLVESADEDTIVMDSGCLCCTIRGDLVDTLRRLIRKRAGGEVPRFDRVVIETTGLADPAPILHTLMTDPVVTAQFRLDGVVTTVDAVHGETQLDSHPESVKQAAVADRILVTKPDMVPDTAALEQRLRDINPAAPVRQVTMGEIPAATLFNAGLYDPTTKTTDVERWLKEEAYAAANAHDHHHHHDVNRHDDRICAYCLSYDEAIDWTSFVDWVEALTTVHGDRLLRLKGILNVVGADGPVAVHGIHHVFHPPAMLPEWPSEERRSRLVMITRDLPREPVEEMLRAFLETGKTA